MTNSEIVQIGQPAPNFVVYNQNNEEWRLSAHRGKVVALIFYPKDETMVCTRQLCSLRDRWEDYKSTGAVVVGISPDDMNSHKNFANNHKLPLPLLTDPGGKITKQFASHWLYPISFTRGLVVIDAEGIVRCQKTMLRVFRPIDARVISIIRMAQLARHGITIPSWAKKSV